MSQGHNKDQYPDLDPSVQESRGSAQQEANAKLQRALAESRAEAASHAASAYERDTAAAIAASKRDIPAGYFRDPGEEQQEVQRAIRQSADEHLRELKGRGAIADDDRAALDKIKEKSMRDWHKQTWGSPPPEEHAWRERSGAYTRTQNPYIEPRSRASTLDDDRLATQFTSLDIGVGDTHRTTRRNGNTQLPPTTYSRGQNSRTISTSTQHSTNASNSPLRGPRDAGFDARQTSLTNLPSQGPRSHVPAAPTGIPTIRTNTSSFPTTTRLQPSLAPTLTSPSRVRPTQTSRTHQTHSTQRTRAPPGYPIPPTTTRLAPPESVMTTDSMLYNPTTNPHRNPPTRPDQGHPTPAPPSLAPQTQARSTQSEASKREAIYRQKQQQDYARSLARDREKKEEDALRRRAEERRREEEELRKEVEMERLESELRGHGGTFRVQEEGQKEGQREGQEEEEDAEPDDVEFVKRKRLAFFEQRGG